MTASPTSPHLSQLAFQLSQDGRHEQALDLLQRAQQSEPENPYLAVNLAYCALAAGQASEAVTVLESAESLFQHDQLRSLPVLERLIQAWLLAQQPQHAQSLLDVHAPLSDSLASGGLVLHASVAAARQDSDLALSLFSRLHDPEDRDAISAPLSSLLIQQGRLQDAEQVLVMSPGTVHRADLVTNLAILASELGRISRARGLYLQAVELEPESFVPTYNLARFHFLQGEHDRARSSVTQALQLAPQAREGYVLLEQIESGCGDFQTALSVIQQWRRIHPHDPAAEIAGCRLYVALEDHEQLSTLLPHLVARCPGHPDLLALLAGLPRQVRLMQGLSDSIVRSFDPELQVKHQRAAIPDDLCDSLERLILADPTLHGQRPYKPSRLGSQTHELFSEPLDDSLTALVCHLRPHLERMISSFLPEQRQSLAYPSSADSLAFSGWGVVLESGGYQAPHVHPESLFSGVVYLRMPSPDAESSETNPAPGSLCFYGDGVRNVLDHDSSLPSHHFATQSILPASGDLILFPSYLWHGTVPFASDGPRICLAFNVLPKV